MMTAKELAELLSGREVGNEITSAEAQRASDAGLVVAFGYSDDNVEFRGNIDDETGAYRGAVVHLNNPSRRVLANTPTPLLPRRMRRISSRKRHRSWLKREVGHAKEKDTGGRTTSLTRSERTVGKPKAYITGSWRSKT